MKLLVLAALVALAQATSLEEHWQAFKLKHGKTYKSLLEEKRRFAIFQDTLKEIEEHNQRYARGEVSYYLGITQFTDMTLEEFKAGLVQKPTFLEPVKWFKSSGAVSSDDIDWVDSGAVTNVKNQGNCESSWAFAAAGAVEAQVQIKTGVLQSLSAKNLLDCVSGTSCSDTEGTELERAFKYIKANGILKESEYTAYDAAKHQCTKRGGQKIASYVNLEPYNEWAIFEALAICPIAVWIDASLMKQYTGGVYGTESGCTQQVNHAVLIVGTGTAKNTEYWTVKNSWGEDWGEDGYIRIARGESACGISEKAWYPTI